MDSIQNLTSSAADRLAALSSPVIDAGHTEYDAARHTFYHGLDRHPALVARPVDAAEVAQVIAAARETGLPLAVRSGGHGAAGHSAWDGSLVLDLSAMKAIDIDPGRRTAWAETGLTAAEYTTATAEHGLVTGFGDTGSVGIGGITLGGSVALPWGVLALGAGLCESGVWLLCFWFRIVISLSFWRRHIVSCWGTASWCGR